MLGSSTPFGRQFRELPGDRRRQFLVDLWTARGFDSEIDGEIVIARSPEKQVRIGTTDDQPVQATDVDIVVGSAESSAADSSITSENDIAYVGSDILETHLRYGIEPAVADRLCLEYFGKPLDALVDRSGFAGIDQSTHRLSVRTIGGPIVIGCLLLGFLVLWGGALGFTVHGDIGVAEATPVDGFPWTTGTTAPDAVTGGGAAGVGGNETGDTLDSSLPPGITMNGTIVPDEHIAAHLTLANQSALGGTVSIVGQPEAKRFDGDLYLSPAGHGNWIWGLYWIGLEVENVAIHEITRYGDELIIQRFDGQSDRPVRVQQPETAVEDPIFRSSDTVYRISTAGNPDPFHFDIENVRLHTYVTPEGRIVYFTLRFRYPTSGEQVLIRFEGD